MREGGLASSEPASRESGADFIGSAGEPARDGAAAAGEARVTAAHSMRAIRRGFDTDDLLVEPADAGGTLRSDFASNGLGDPVTAGSAFTT
jgi:hypothetical protein